MSWTARPAGIYDGSGADVLVAATTTPSQTAVVADRARVRALAGWMSSRGMAHDAVASIDQDDVRLDPATSARLATQLRRAGQVLRELPVLGLAWFDDANRVVVGGTLGADLGDGGQVLSSQTCQVSAHVDATGAYLLVRDHDGSTVRVQRWKPGKDGGVLVDGDPVSASIGEALLRLSAAPANVQEAPATSVVAALLTTVQEMAQNAASGASVLAVETARKAPAHVTR